MNEVNSLNNGNIKDSKSNGLEFALAGLGCVAIAIPFSLSAKDHLHKSIDHYNANLIGIKNTSEVKVRFMASTNSFGIKMTF